jgi:hypothetical protein
LSQLFKAWMAECGAGERRASTGLFGFTRVDGAEPVPRIAPQSGGVAAAVGGCSLVGALTRTRQLSESS